MCAVVIGAGKNKVIEYLPNNFNKKKFWVNYGVPTDELLVKMQNVGKKQCLSKQNFDFYGAV